MYELKTEAHFDSAHFLTDYNGKCENIHGHRWRVVVYMQTDELQTEGTNKDMVLDFAVFKEKVNKVAELFDHTFIVEEDSLQPETFAALQREGFTFLVLPFRTTAENLARHFGQLAQKQGLNISRVEMYETPKNCAIWYA